MLFAYYFVWQIIKNLVNGVDRPNEIKGRNTFESSVCSANLLQFIIVFVHFDFEQGLNASLLVGVAPVKVALHLLF